MKKPTIPAVLGILFFLGSGAVYLAMGVYPPTAPIEPEAQLAEAEGIPVGIKDVGWGSGDQPNPPVVYFVVNGHRVFHDGTSAKYWEVLEAIRSGQRLKVWFSTREYTSEVGGPRFFKLYQLSLPDRPVLTYADLAHTAASGGRFSLIYGSVLTVIGLTIGYLSIR